MPVVTGLWYPTKGLTPPSSVTRLFAGSQSVRRFDLLNISRDRQGGHGHGQEGGGSTGARKRGSSRMNIVIALQGHLYPNAVGVNR